MKITDRIVLLKAGYSKDDIKAMIEEENKEASSSSEETTNKTSTDDFMAVITSLANEVKEMKTAIHKENIEDTSIKEVSNLDEATKILTELINPVKTTNKEEK